MTPCKNILTFAANFSYPLSPNEFLSFSENSTFDFMIRFCFYSPLVYPYCRTPVCEVFCTQPCHDFANPANPVLTPWFIFYCSNDGARGAGGGVGGGGGGSKFNHVFLHRWTHPNLYFSTLFITLQQKFIHVAGHHHGSRQNIRLVRTPMTANK